MVPGDDGRLFLLALEDPASAHDGEAVALLLDAAERARSATGLQAAEVGVLVGDRWGDEVAAEVKRRGLTLVLAADDRRQERFAFADGDDFGRAVEAADPDVTGVRLRWHPDDAPETKKAQALGLTKLAAWLHETDRRLLVEVVVPAGEDAANGADPGDDRDGEAGPEHVRRALAEIRDLGTEPDLWGVAGHADPRGAEAIGATARDEGRDEVGVLVRVGREDADAVLRASAPVGAYRGAVLGPDLWAAELEALAAGEHAREDAVGAIGDRIAHIIDLYTAAQPA